MQELTPKQKKNLQRLAKIVDKGNIGVFEHLIELEDRMEEEIPSIKDVISRVKGEKGDKGDKGEKGDKGTDGRNGLNGRDGKNALNGKDGKDGKNGKDGKDGKNGVDGKNATEIDVENLERNIEMKLPQFGSTFRDGLELLPRGSKLSQDAVENLPETIQDLRERIGYVGASKGGGGATGKIIAGSNISIENRGTDTVINSTASGSGGQVNTVVAGTGISVDSTDPVNPIVTSTITQYTDELAQDAVGGIVANSTFVSTAYNDTTPSITSSLSATGTPSASTFLRGDNTWATPAGSGDVSKVGTPVNNQVGVWTGDGTIEGDVDLTFDTTTNTLGVGLIGLDGRVQVHAVKSDASDGLLIEASNGTDVGILGVGNTANATWYGSHNIEGGQVAIGKDATTLGKVKLYGNTSGDVTIQPNAVAGTGIVLTAPATTGTIALTSQLHDAVTVADTSEIDLTLTGQQISASLVASSIDETKLDASVNASLDLADTALQSLSGAVLTDQTVGQTIGATGARLTKLWVTDITATNAIAGSVTGNAATVTTNANLTGVVTSVGNATAIADSALSIAKTSGLQTALDAKQSTITFGTGVQTALGVNIGSAGASVLFNGALGTPSSGTVTNLTGTASININGTVGATTPAAGTFTTLVAGSTTSLLLGTAGSAVGNIGFRNATSGTITLAPTTGALGTITTTLPAFTGTVCVAATSTTTTQALFASSTAGQPAYRAIAAGDLPATLTSGTAITNAALTTPAAFTTGGTITLAENTSIALDPAGSADGKYTGITVTATAGYTQAFGDLVYLSSVDSRWELADADALATAGNVALGMVVVAGTDGASCTLLMMGRIRADAKFPAMTVGATQYVGETAGAIQGTIPTGADNIIRTVGYAITADELYFAPSSDWQVTVA